MISAHSLHAKVSGRSSSASRVIFQVMKTQSHRMLRHSVRSSRRVVLRYFTNQKYSRVPKLAALQKRKGNRVVRSAKGRLMIPLPHLYLQATFHEYTMDDTRITIDDVTKVEVK